MAPDCVRCQVALDLITIPVVSALTSVGHQHVRGVLGGGKEDAAFLRPHQEQLALVRFEGDRSNSLLHSVAYLVTFSQRSSELELKFVCAPQRCFDQSPIGDSSVPGDAEEVQVAIKVVWAPTNLPHDVSVLPV